MLCSSIPTRLSFFLSQISVDSYSIPLKYAWHQCFCRRERVTLSRGFVVSNRFHVNSSSILSRISLNSCSIPLDSTWHQCFCRRQRVTLYRGFVVPNRSRLNSSSVLFRFALVSWWIRLLAQLTADTMNGMLVPFMGMVPVGRVVVG